MAKSGPSLALQGLDPTECYNTYVTTSSMRLSGQTSGRQLFLTIAHLPLCGHSPPGSLASANQTQGATLNVLMHGTLTYNIPLS